MTTTSVNEEIIELGDDGIHKRIQRIPLNEDGTRKSWEGLTENHFWEHIEWLMADSERILIENGFPSPKDRAFYAVDYGWLLTEAVPENEIQEKIKTLCEKRDLIAVELIRNEWGNPKCGTAFGDQIAIELDDVFQEAWYAGNIYSLCHLVNINKQSSYSVHLSRIYQIAEFEKDREWRRKFKGMIISEINQIEGRRLGGAITRAQTKEKNIKIVSAMREYINNNIDITVAAELVYIDGIGTSPSANHRCWYRNKDKY